jgi:hypothetical protein
VFKDVNDSSKQQIDRTSQGSLQNINICITIPVTLFFVWLAILNSHDWSESCTTLIMSHACLICVFFSSSIIRFCQMSIRWTFLFSHRHTLLSVSISLVSFL